MAQGRLARDGGSAPPLPRAGCPRCSCSTNVAWTTGIGQQHIHSELSGRRLVAGAAERLGGSTRGRRAVPAQAAGPTAHCAASSPVHPSGLVEGRGRRPGLLLVPQQLAQPPHRAWGCLGRARCGELPHYRVPRSRGPGGGLQAGLGTLGAAVARTCRAWVVRARPGLAWAPLAQRVGLACSPGAIA